MQFNNMSEFLIEKENLSGLDLDLQRAYKNIIFNLVRLSIDKTSSIDPISSSYMGVDEKYPDFNYSALLDATSYFWASKGGRGKLLEKAVAHLTNSQADKRLNQVVEESAITSKFDVILIDGKKLVLIEMKNRIDSGGTAGRKEGLQKFFNIVKQQKHLDLLYEKFDHIDMVFGIPYNTKGQSATLQDDANFGFQGETRNLMRDNLNIDDIKFELIGDSLDQKFSISTLYGDDFTNRIKPGLTVQKIHDTLFPKIWQDLKIALKMCIEQRTLLLKNNNNLFTLLESLEISGTTQVRLEYVKDKTKIHYIYDEKYIQNCIILHKTYQESR